MNANMINIRVDNPKRFHSFMDGKILDVCCIKIS
jgi:hypothetical protein